MEFLSALAPIAGGVINNLFAGNRQDEAQNFAREQAATAEATFRTNRQTAYQDTMADMAKAGLNPILAYQKGATAGTMGVTPSPSITPTSDFGVGAAASTALQVRRQNYEIENMKEQNALLKAQTAKTSAEKDTELNRPSNVAASTRNLEAQTGFTEQQVIKGMADAMTSTQLGNWIADNRALAQAMIVAAWGGGKLGDTLAPFKNAVEGLFSGAKSSAPSTTRNMPTPPGSSAKQMPSPNDYRRNQPGWEPAPPKPDRGWFTDRWQGINP